MNIVVIINPVKDPRSSMIWVYGVDPKLMIYDREKITMGIKNIALKRCNFQC